MKQAKLHGHEKSVDQGRVLPFATSPSSDGFTYDRNFLPVRLIRSLFN